MIKLILNKISKNILNKQDLIKINLFNSINKNKNKLCLFDIGGAGGLQSRWKIFQKYLKVVFFEPDKRSSSELSNNGFEVIEKALWSDTTQKELYLTKKLETSSMYIPNRSFLDMFPDSNRYDVVKTIKVEVTKLDNLINKKIQPHFIKIDIQGAELEVLKGSVNTLKNVLGLEVEVNFKEIYKKIPLAHDVEKFLNSQEFVLNDFLTYFRWERSPQKILDKDQIIRFGEMIHGDALFLRTPENITEMCKNVSDPVSLLENYIKILFIYNKLDLIKKLSEYISEEEKKILNLNGIMSFLEKKHKRLIFFNKKFLYFTRYFVSKDILPHWKL